LQPAAKTRPRSCGAKFDLSLFFLCSSPSFCLVLNTKVRKRCIALHFFEVNHNERHLLRASRNVFMCAGHRFFLQVTRHSAGHSQHRRQRRP
jgi:hypothetical protein